MSHVLVVDDDPSILTTVKAGLIARHFQVTAVSTARAAIDALMASTPDVVVLDLGLPDMDGIDVVRRVRDESAVPIIVLSADGSEARKVLALELGADDYVTKPFSIAELVARVRVALRHQPRVEDGPALKIITVGALTVDVGEHICTVDGEHVDLTPKEFGMLAVLARRPGRLVTHQMLLQEVWGNEYRTENHYLRVYASQLRKKLGDGANIPEIRSESGVGYRLVLETGPVNE